MRANILSNMVLAAILLAYASAASGQAPYAMGTAFTYQGQLKDGGGPVDDTCDFEFSLWDDSAGGTQQGSTVGLSTPVDEGLFTVRLDFGEEFNGQARWLQMEVCCPSGACTLELLTPRVELTPAPHALALPGLYTQQNAVTDTPNVVGGNAGNEVGSVVGATISGGGSDANPNRATHNYATVGGGESNWAASPYTTVAGGQSNQASGGHAAVGGGWGNIADSYWATVPGGRSNEANGWYSFAAGHRAKANHDGTFVWGDSTDADFASTDIDQFLIRAAGGVGIGTNDPQAMLHIGGTPDVDGIMFPDGSLQTTADTGDTLGGLSCTDGQIAKWNDTGTAWECAADDTGADGNTLDQAYDQGGAGAGRTITADTGAVEILGPDGLVVSGTITSGSSITIDGVNDKIECPTTMEFHVGGARVFRMEPYATSPNLIGGYSGNYATATVHGATIAGGGENAALNRVHDDYGTIGGGGNNQAGDNAGDSTDAPYATVSGGKSNTASNYYATVGGGTLNEATAAYCTVSGGYNNTASSSTAAVGGGSNNVASFSAATVGGGSMNTASGGYSTVPGGGYNLASGYYSFAAGRKARAEDNGAFVWADNTDACFYSERDNQFRVRANGGAKFDDGTEWVDIRNDATDLITTSTGAHLTLGGVWTDNSDRARKDNHASVDVREVLRRVSAIPVSTWHYKVEDSSVRHMGVMAQDFYAAFGLGNDERHIAALDTGGVALAAIQGLHEIVKEKDTEITELKARLSALEQLIHQAGAAQEGGGR
jgi:hypothetical protein